MKARAALLASVPSRGPAGVARPGRGGPHRPVSAEPNPQAGPPRRLPCSLDHTWLGSSAQCRASFRLASGCPFVHQSRRGPAFEVCQPGEQRTLWNVLPLFLSAWRRSGIMFRTVFGGEPMNTDHVSPPVQDDVAESVCEARLTCVASSMRCGRHLAKWTNSWGEPSD